VVCRRNSVTVEDHFGMMYIQRIVTNDCVCLLINIVYM